MSNSAGEVEPRLMINPPEHRGRTPPPPSLPSSSRATIDEHRQRHLGAPRASSRSGSGLEVLLFWKEARAAPPKAAAAAPQPPRRARRRLPPPRAAAAAPPPPLTARDRATAGRAFSTPHAHAARADRMKDAEKINDAAASGLGVAVNRPVGGTRRRGGAAAAPRSGEASDVEARRCSHRRAGRGDQLNAARPLPGIRGPHRRPSAAAGVGGGAGADTLMDILGGSTRPAHRERYVRAQLLRRALHRGSTNDVQIRYRQDDRRVAPLSAIKATWARPRMARSAPASVHRKVWEPIERRGVERQQLRFDAQRKQSSSWTSDMPRGTVSGSPRAATSRRRRQFDGLLALRASRAAATARRCARRLARSCCPSRSRRRSCGRSRTPSTPRRT